MIKVEELKLRNYLFSKKQFLNIFYFWFPLLTSVGFFYHLQDKPLWADEIQTWHTVSRSNWADFFTSLTTEHAHPPLYFFVMWLIGHFVDWTEYTLRFFSAFCALGANVALFLFFKKKISNVFAVCFSIAFGFSYSIRYFAQEARPYALLIFLSCVSFIFFIELLEKLNTNTEKKIYFFRWLITVFFLMCSHYYGILLALSEGAIFLFFSIKRKKLFFTKSFILFFSLFATALSFFVVKDIKLEKLVFLDKLNISIFLKEIFSELENILIIDQYLWIIFILLVMNYFLFIKKFNVRLSEEKKNIIFIFLCLIGTFLIFFLFLYLASLVRPIYTFRYLYFLNPIFLYSLVAFIYFLLEIMFFYIAASVFKSVITKVLFLVITICIVLEMFKINLGQTDYNRILTKTNLRELSEKYNKFDFLFFPQEKVFIESKKTHELEFYVHKMGLEVKSLTDQTVSRKEKEFEYEQILNVEAPESFLYLFYSENEFEKENANINGWIHFFNNLNYKESILVEDKKSSLVRFVLLKK